MSYVYSDLLKAYARVGVARGRVVYVTSDLGRLADYEVRDKAAIMDAHFRALTDLLGPEGTLVVPTASMNLCNTDIPFDNEKTPSYRVGALSEYVRTRPGARRSFHPFVSYTAIGEKKGQITGNVSRHAFGMETPEARMIEMNALSVSAGVEPRLTCSTVHHVEMVMGVPYRYAKEYMHPVVRDGQVVVEAFYQYVWYYDSDVKRSRNKTVFARFSEEQEIGTARVGRATIYSYPMAAFFRIAVKLFAEDIYIWCKHPPTIRPWRK